MKRVAAVLVFFIFVSSAQAEIGESLKKFRQSSLVKGHKFFQDASWESERLSLTTGYKMYLFKDQTKRYFVEIMADEANTFTYRESLSFAFTKEESQFQEDQGVALEFAKEASGGKIDAEEFAALLKSVKSGPVGRLYKKVLGDFIIKASLFQHALYQEISITITSKENPR